MSEKLYVNTHVWPACGMTFVDAQSVKHSGSSLEGLISNVRDFRLRLGMPMGDPAREVADYICSQDPSACRPAHRASAEAKKPSAGISTFATRIIQWLVRTADAASRGRYNLLSKEKANKRAEICAKCPRNVGWRTGCGGCDESYKRVGFAIRKGQSVRLEKKLGACEILVEDTATSVFLPLKPVDNPDLPKGCWRKL